MTKKINKYSVGDIVLFKEAKHTWGWSKSHVRDMGFPMLEGETGVITGISRVWRWSSKKSEVYYTDGGIQYPYSVNFNIVTKSGKALTRSYRMAEDELELVFIK